MRDLFNKTFPEPVQQAIKEALRLALIAGVSFLISFGLKYAAGMPETQTTVILTFVLRALDSWMHEHGKATGNDTLAGGLTRF